MAAEFQSSSVPQLFSKLCYSIIEHAERKERTQRATSVLQLPAHLHKQRFSNRQALHQQLYRLAFDLLLLRRSDWYGKRRSALCPESLCLAVGFLYQEHGHHEEARRIMAVTHQLSVLLGEEAPPLLAFLAMLSSGPVDEVCCVEE